MYHSMLNYITNLPARQENIVKTSEIIAQPPRCAHTDRHRRARSHQWTESMRRKICRVNYLKSRQKYLRSLVQLIQLISSTNCWSEKKYVVWAT